MGPKQFFLFPPFRLDPGNGQLWRDQQAMPLKPKTFAVLEHLVTRAGQLVTKEELLDTLWADVQVSDAVLKTYIREIRQVLGDTPQTSQFIDTVHRRGYRFIGPVARSQHSGVSRQTAASSPPPLVGREAELKRLYGWLEKALCGERQMVFVIGEAGIGKTAVVNALLGQLAARDDLWVAQGQCLEQYGAGEAYLPVLTAFGQLCREPAGERVKEVLGHYAPTWLMQLPALLSTAELDALQRRVIGATHERMLREMAEAIDALTLDRGVILWLDDLQWSDYATLDLMQALARRPQPARLLVIGAYRPVDVIIQDHPLKVVKQDLQLHGQCAEVSLELLAETAVQEYVAARFAGQTGLAVPLQALARLIHRRTEGNPLFVISVVEDLVLQGVIVQRNGQWEAARKVEEVVVPAGIRQFIEQQVERLSPDVQQVLEAASVAGMEFSAAAVAAGVDAEVGEVEAKCEALTRRRQFLQPSGPGEWPDGTIAARYRFIHALYQQVLYERVPAGRCASLHRQIGEREEAAYGHQATKIAAELALHFERGRDYPRAVQYLQQAGGNAMQLSAHQEAVTLLTRGLELLQTLPDTAERDQHELRLRILLGEVLTTVKGFGASEVAQAYTRAHELCRHRGETPQIFRVLLGRVLVGLYAHYVERAELTTAYDLAEQLRRLAQNMRSQSLFPWASLELGMVLHFRGDQVGARQHLEQSCALYDPQQTSALGSQYDPGVLSLSMAAPVLWLLGYPEQALQRSQEALGLARELAHPYNLAYALNLALRTQWLRGDQLAVQELQEALMALSCEQGFASYLALANVWGGWLLAEQGRVEEGLEQMRQELAAWRATGAEAVRSYYVALLAEACGKAGQTEEGVALLDEALAEGDKSGERFYEAELYRLKGELPLAQAGCRLQAVGYREKAEETEKCFRKAIEIARKQQAKSLELRAVMSLSRLWQKQGKKDEARQILADIYNWFTEGVDTADLREAKMLLEELS